MAYQAERPKSVAVSSRQGRAGKGLSVLPDRNRAGDLVGALNVGGDRPVVFETTSGVTIDGSTGATPSGGRRDAAVPIKEIARIGTVAAVHLRFGGSGPEPTEETTEVTTEVTTDAPGGEPTASRITGDITTESAEGATSSLGQQELGLDAD